MSDERIRLDVWLWQARFFKTRKLSAKMVEKGRIRLHRGGQIARIKKPGTPVRVGDEVIFARGLDSVQVRIEKLGTRRGPATEAVTLYHILASDTAEGASAN